MFLRHLRVKNLRSIGEVEISFEGEAGEPRLWTMMLGQNGVGKSTLLKAIALATAGGDALAELMGNPDQWIRAGSKMASIELEYATASHERRSVALTIKRGLGVRSFLAQNRKSLETLERAIGHAARNYFIVGYGVSRRKSSNDFLTASNGPYRNKRAQNVATLFSADATLMSVERWAMDLDYRRGKKGISTVRKALDLMMPGVKFEGIDKETRQLLFRTSEGRLPLSQLSDGYQSVAAWCGDILFRMSETFSDFSDPLSARGVLLLDEIDLHLHPLWQRQLVEFLNRTLPRFQIVATTHSPITAHQTGAGELFILQRSKASSPARARQYEGAANELSLDQVIRSPMFGIHTLDSVKVGAMRDIIRRRRGFPTLDTNDVVSHFEPPEAESNSDIPIAELERKVERIDDRSEVPPYLAQTNKLLESLKKEIRKLPASNVRVVKKRVTKSRLRKASKSRR
ncbi:AAA family ATPase [Bradyrhizobium sp. U531]|uniref:AAA family ATPase n=1 Tax=Bradyrhizobium sp. U531 TaxID=3053458 RepID=UPI003F42DD98